MFQNNWIAHSSDADMFWRTFHDLGADAKAREAAMKLGRPLNQGILVIELFPDVVSIAKTGSK